LSQEGNQITGDGVAAGRFAARQKSMSEILITCAQVRRELSNYIDSEVTPQLRARIEEHVAGCSDCAAVYDGVRNVLSLVAGGELIELPRGFSLRLYRRLRNLRD
jgi:hypothetical protein